MTTFVEFMILSGEDNRPPMLDKDLYDSWKSIMELYMQNRENGRMILESVEHGPLIWPTIEENGVNTKFLNSLPPEWSKFVTDVKLVKDLHTTNFDQLNAYLKQHELHANEVRIMRERIPTQFSPSQSPQYGSIHPTQHYSITYPSTPHAITYPLASYPNAYSSTVHQDAYPQPQFIPQIEYIVSTVNQQKHLAEFPQIDSGLAVLGRQSSFAAGTSGTRVNISGTEGNNSGQQRIIKCFNCQGEGHMARQCPKPKRKRDATWFRDKVLLVEAQGSGKVLNEEELEFLADPGVTEDVLSEVPYSENTHNDILNQSVQEMSYSEQAHLLNYPENEITSDSNIIPYSQYLLETQNADV
ncbi:retrovirus-related pol polyprotein from transposon TNT 1-94 [Tanacetum coccineum]